MKILFQKDYDDLLQQIKSAEDSANNAYKKIGKKDDEIENLRNNLNSKNKTLLMIETELAKVREQRSKAEKELKELKRKYQKQNSQKGGYIARINNLLAELDEERKKAAEKDIIIENFKTELKKRIPKKSVIEYEKGIKK